MRKRKNHIAGTSGRYKLKKREWFVLVGVVVIWFFYVKTRDEILNYPSWIVSLVFFSLIVLYALFKRRCLWNKVRGVNDRNSFFSLLLITVQTVIVSLFLTGMLLIPFNYYIIGSSKNSPLETKYCEITGVSTFSQNRKIFYVLEGRTNVTYGYDTVMENIQYCERYKGYQFCADVRSGILGTYILEGWAINKRLE